MELEEKHGNDILLAAFALLVFFLAMSMVNG